MCQWNFPEDCGEHDAELTDQEAKGMLVCPQDEIGNPAKCAPNQHPQVRVPPCVAL